MSDPISNYGRMTQSSAVARSAIEKVDPKGTSAASASEELTLSTLAKVTPGANKFSLSNVKQKVMAQLEFDRANDESIKQAIKDGNYPVKPRRID